MTLFHNRINTNILDRIIVNQKSVELVDNTIQKYLVGAEESFLDNVMKTETSLQLKGIFVIEELLKMSKSSGMYYSIGNNEVTVAELEGDTMTFKAVLTYGGLEINIKSFVFYKESYKRQSVQSQHILKETAKRTVGMIFDFYRYTQLMTYLKQESRVIVKRASINTPKGKTKKELQREARELARRKVSVSQDKRVYDYSEATREGEKRGYERHTESWYSRGYWRRKSKNDDTKIWVEGKEKKAQSGDGKKTGKDFTV